MLAMQENLNYLGAALLQDFLQLQMDDFNSRLDYLHTQGRHKHSIDGVRRFETEAHESGWTQLAQQTRALYKSKRVGQANAGDAHEVIARRLL